MAGRLRTLDQIMDEFGDSDDDLGGLDATDSDIEVVVHDESVRFALQSTSYSLCTMCT